MHNNARVCIIGIIFGIRNHVEIKKYANYANIMQKLCRNYAEIMQKLCRNYANYVNIMHIMQITHKLCRNCAKKIMQNFGKL